LSFFLENYMYQFIDFLKLSRGAWISDRQTIGNTLCTHFANLFTTFHPCFPDELLNLFDNSLTSKENSSICSIPDNSRNLSLKSWDSICLPRNQGDLGLRKMSTTNLALITKLGWKFLHSNSLWVQHLHKKYI